ncbi:MAG: haloacid dehalogenase [Candidatus Verstraetearchaeota archaeon]|nr:haloacid dehalogenase [Candidatus Verstraetearchaeota archaeon]
MSDPLSKLKASIEGISARLSSKVEAREGLSLKARSGIRLCGEAVSLSHRGHIEEAKKRLEEAKEIIEELRPRRRDLELDAFDALAQEYVEAEALVRIIEGRELPSLEELQVADEAYVLGMADLIGELRRRALEEMRRGNGSEAERLYELMKGIYELIWPLEYPRSLVPGLRHKLDAMRRVLDETLHDLTLMKILTTSREDKKLG